MIPSLPMFKIYSYQLLGICAIILTIPGRAQSAVISGFAYDDPLVTNTRWASTFADLPAGETGVNILDSYFEGGGTLDLTPTTFASTNPDSYVNNPVVGRVG